MAGKEGNRWSKGLRGQIWIGIHFENTAEDVAQLTECLLCMHKALCLNPSSTQPGVVLYAPNPAFGRWRRQEDQKDRV